MDIRHVNHEQREDWLRLRMALWPGPADEHEAEVDAFFAGRGLLRAVFVCVAGSGGLSGFLELSLRNYAEGCRSNPVPFVEGWFVTPSARGRSVGRSLMAAAEDWARGKGYAEIASDTLLDNTPGYEAHRALGFDEVDRSINLRKSL